MLSDTINQYRLIPRALMLTYMILLFWATEWFMALHAPNTAQGAFIGVVWGAGAAWFKIYVDGKPSA